jgi:hypothetical protein
LTNKNKRGDKEHITKADILKFMKSFRIRLSGHVERMQNQRMPKQIAKISMEEKEGREMPHKR